MTPYLITGPSVYPVAIADLKADPRMRIETDETDDAILQVQAGIVSMLDGWGGELNRCIMPQTWAIDVTGPGPHVLPFPDASSITVTSGGEAVASVLTKRTGRGFEVTCEDVLTDEEITIQAVYGLSAEKLPAAEQLITLMVQRHFDVLSGPDYEAATKSIEAHIRVLRWRRV